MRITWRGLRRMCGRPHPARVPGPGDAGPARVARDARRRDRDSPRPVTTVRVAVRAEWVGSRSGPILDPPLGPVVGNPWGFGRSEAAGDDPLQDDRLAHVLDPIDPVVLVALRGTSRLPVPTSRRSMPWSNSTWSMSAMRTSDVRGRPTPKPFDQADRGQHRLVILDPRHRTRASGKPQGTGTATTAPSTQCRATEVWGNAHVEGDRPLPLTPSAEGERAGSGTIQWGRMLVLHLTWIRQQLQSTSGQTPQPSFAAIEPAVLRTRAVGTRLPSTRASGVGGPPPTDRRAGWRRGAPEPPRGSGPASRGWC